jgi:hypothetical protein
VNGIVLHNYFRSSTSHRVRIALALKELEYSYVAHHLRHGGHHAPAFLAINPQGLVPALVWNDDAIIAQSMAIIEFLDEMVPSPPLLPADPFGRARVRMLSQMIACDIHPLNNLRVLNALRSRYGHRDRRLVQALGQRDLHATGKDAGEQPRDGHVLPWRKPGHCGHLPCRAGNQQCPIFSGYVAISGDLPYPRCLHGTAGIPERGTGAPAGRRVIRPQRQR